MLRLYFAYGSNLNFDDLAAWCAGNGREMPDMEVVGKAFLPDHEPVYDGYSPGRGGGVLNIRSRIGQILPGLMLRLDPQGEETLDLKEHYPEVYTKMLAIPLFEDGGAATAFTYVVGEAHREKAFVRPSPEYARIVRQGLMSHRIVGKLHEAAERGAMMPRLIEHVFCYGTLMSGESRSALIEAVGKVETRTKAVTRGRMYDLGEFPAMTIGSSHHENVRGELVRVDRIGELLTVLDRIEGFHGYGAANSLFERRIVWAQTEDRNVLAWVYVMEHPPNAPSIAGGNWRERSGDRRRSIE